MFVSKMRHVVANIVALSAQIFGRLKPGVFGELLFIQL